MIAAFTIIAGFVFPMMLALMASALSLAALKRHLTVRQILLTALVLTAGVASVTIMYSSLTEHNSIAIWPLLVIGGTVIFSILQFGTALILGTVTQLRRLAVK